MKRNEMAGTIRRKTKKKTCCWIRKSRSDCPLSILAWQEVCLFLSAGRQRIPRRFAPRNDKFYGAAFRETVSLRRTHCPITGPRQNAYPTFRLFQSHLNLMESGVGPLRLEA